MRFIRFPNGKVWQVDENKVVKGSVYVPGYDSIEGLESRLDAIAESATGSCAGLTDFSYTHRGGDIVEFEGQAEFLPDAEEDFAEDDFAVLPVDSPALEAALAAQYELSREEARHAVSWLKSLGGNPPFYGAESIMNVFGAHRQIHTPASPEQCSYVRITVAGLEIAYWTADEWHDDPAVVMGAIIGTAKGA